MLGKKSPYLGIILVRCQNSAPHLRLSSSELIEYFPFSSESTPIEDDRFPVTVAEQ